MSISKLLHNDCGNTRVGSNFSDMRNLITYFLILTFFCANGQEITFGDTAIIKSIQSKCSIIYDTKDTTTFLLTKTSFYKTAISGTNLIIDSYKKKINRIVAFTTTQDGLLGIEFYYWDSRIIMIYETMEYYGEDSPKGQIRNFKNIPYWESRFYIDNNKLVAQRHSGRKGIQMDYNAQTEIANSKKIFEFVKKNTSLN
jgi:hypothetical protein